MGPGSYQLATRLDEGGYLMPEDRTVLARALAEHNEPSVPSETVEEQKEPVKVRAGLTHGELEAVTAV
ncbi:MAG: hypothetical protein WC897_04605 [Candidatus Gracilibacteria bacterium]